MSTKDDGDSEPSDEHACPWDGCERSFDTLRGMKIHHKRSHGESIAGVTVECDWCGGEKKVKPAAVDVNENHFCSPECQANWRGENRSGDGHPSWSERVTITCDWCGSEKEVIPSQSGKDHHFCDRTCFGNWRSANRSGENHPSWTGGKRTVSCAACGDTKDVDPHVAEKYDRHFCGSKCRGRWISENHAGENNPSWQREQVECAWCGEEKSVPPYRLGQENHFCDWECQGQWLSENQQGEKAPAWKGGLVTVDCSWCGEDNEIIPAREAAYEKHFCDQECQGEWLSENNCGENHPLYQGGYFPYGSGFTDKKKEKVRERQERKCAGCETHESQFRRKLDVHHIEKARWFDEEDADQRNSEDNLVALCEECHPKWEKMSPLRPQTELLDD